MDSIFRVLYYFIELNNNYKAGPMHSGLVNSIGHDM